jgi:tyrosinase
LIAPLKEKQELTSCRYWDETADVAAFPDSPLLQPSAFGGDGVGNGTRKCIQDGPFVDTRLRLRKLGEPPEEYCIYRDFNATFFEWAAQARLDACYAKPDYNTAWECWQEEPHGAGHAGVGGLMVDVALSPGDPLFYLHHGWLDSLWWKWQTLDLENRLTDSEFFSCIVY